MAKDVQFSADARARLKRGVDIMVDAVSATLGPKGRNVLIDKGFGSPAVTKDGVTVAKSVILADQTENMAALLLREAAAKTENNCGDGTTTATLLTGGIFNQAMKALASGANPVGLKRGLDLAAEETVKSLKKTSRPVKGGEIEKVASISANDAEIGKVIADTINRVGKDGAVSVEESPKIGMFSEVVEGMRLERGFISPYFVTDSEKMRAEMKDARVIVTTEKISSPHDIVPLLQKLMESGAKSIVIVADDIEGEALATLVMNKLQARLNVCGVRAPWYGERKKELLKDLAAVTGGMLISKETGIDLKEATPEMVGSCLSVTVTKDFATFTGGGGQKEKIEERITQAKNEIESNESEVEEEFLKKRLAKLSGGVGVIKVGAATETELKEIKQRVEDSLGATTAAAKEGIVPGGGIALLNALSSVRDNEPKGLTEDEQAGYNILVKVLDQPVRKIAENAGLDGSTVLSKLLAEENSSNYGYDAATGKYGDMIELGIIDPTLVVKSAVRNAVSVAGLLLTTEVTVAEIPEEKQPEPGPALHV